MTDRDLLRAEMARSRRGLELYVANSLRNREGGGPGPVDGNEFEAMLAMLAEVSGSGRADEALAHISHMEGRGVEIEAWRALELARLTDPSHLQAAERMAREFFDGEGES